MMSRNSTSWCVTLSALLFVGALRSTIPQEPVAEDLAGILAPEAKVEQLATGFIFTEGPVWVPDGEYLLFSDVPGDEIRKWKDGKVTSYRKPSHNANGNRLDGKGRLITCEHGSRTLTRTDAEGKVETLIGDFDGLKLNSPNDLAVRSDGTIWFSDPDYGVGKREREIDENFVFCFQPDSGELFIAAEGFRKPNGVCLSPDEKRLYVADSGGPRHIRVFDVARDGSLTGGEVFAKIDIGAPDGMRCDRAGRLFSSAGDGVHVFAPDGKLLGKILVPESPSNLCFGGEEGTTLFMTARTSIYAIEVRTAGRDWNPALRAPVPEEEGASASEDDDR